MVIVSLGDIRKEKEILAQGWIVFSSKMNNF